MVQGETFLNKTMHQPLRGSRWETDRPLIKRHNVVGEAWSPVPLSIQIVKRFAKEPQDPNRRLPVVSMALALPRMKPAEICRRGHVGTGVFSETTIRTVHSGDGSLCH